MQNKKILDTSVWIGFLDIANPNHVKSRKIIEDCDFSDVYITEYVFLEVVTILKQNAGQEKTQKFIEFCGEYIEFIPSEQFFVQTREIYIELREKKLSFVGASLLYLSSEYEIITNDKMLCKWIEKIR